MRKIRVKNMGPGMKTARPVYGNQGQMLLNSGVSVGPSYARGLLAQGIEYIFVQDNRLDDVGIHEAVRNSTRIKAYALAKDIIEKARAVKENRKFLQVKEKEIIKTVDEIIRDVLDNRDIMVNIETIKTADSYTYTHSVDVCILSTLMAAKMKLKTTTLRNLAVGALLHDLGKIKIPPAILNKPGPLTEEEFAEIKKHPAYGYEILKEGYYFPASCAQVIYQHHERDNGQGYPRGLTGGETNPLAKIAAIADVYDALVSSRPYRKPYPPCQAVEILRAMGAEELDRRLLCVVLSFLAVYSVGTQVHLSSGERGVVIGNTEGYPDRPRVRVLYRDEATPLKESYDLDLTKKLDITITDVH